MKIIIQLIICIILAQFVCSLKLFAVENNRVIIMQIGLEQYSATIEGRIPHHPREEFQVGSNEYKNYSIRNDGYSHQNAVIENMRTITKELLENLSSQSLQRLKKCAKKSLFSIQFELDKEGKISATQFIFEAGDLTTDDIINLDTKARTYTFCRAPKDYNLNKALVVVNVRKNMLP